MLGLQKLFLFSLVSLLFLQTAAPSKQDLNDQLFEAVRKGDAAGVTAALDRGADVNAKFRYGQTALFKAAERGNAEVTKILLDRGAEVNVKDTFYKATPTSWAIDGKHVQVVLLLLAKGAEEVEDGLLMGVRESNAELVKAALDRGTLKPESLTVAFAISSSNEKNAAITDMLTKAGAKPPFQVDAATLQSYTGKYKADPGPQATITVKDGKLFVAGFSSELQPLMALDNTTFRLINFGGITVTFNVEEGKVTSATLKQGPNATPMKRVGDVNQ
jgi:ankyrin repeat protein